MCQQGPQVINPSQMFCRFGIGRFTTAAEVDRAVELTVRHVTKLREMSPLWELVQEGVDLKSIQWSQH